MNLSPVHVTGLDNPSGMWYLLWSGFAPFVSGNFDRLATLAVVWRHFNCHEPGCWDIGRRHHGQPSYCHKHRPAPPNPTALEGET